jgi:hypothetical protein
VFDILQGSARVIQCLQDGRDQLGVYCRAALFDFEQDMAEDIDFKAPLKVVIGWRKSGCHGVEWCSCIGDVSQTTSDTAICTHLGEWCG